MLEVTFYRDPQGRPSGLRAYGHVDFAAYGEDVVCASVSAILQAARLGLDEYADALQEARQEPGELELHLRDGCRQLESVRAIIKTAELAVEQIARQYPEHIRLKRVTLEAGNTSGQPKEN